MRPKVLIVDDDGDMRALVETLAEREGFATVTAAGGAAAIQELSRHDYALVLLDLMMPEVSGLDVIDHLRRHPGPPGQIILLLSAAPESLLAPVSPRVIHGVLRKPFAAEEFSQLLRGVRSALAGILEQEH